MKKLLYLIMAVCLIASLAACRGMDRIDNNGPVNDAEDGIVDNNGSEDGVIGDGDDGIFDRNDADNRDNRTDTEFPENNVSSDGDTVYPGGGIIDGNTENGTDSGMSNGTDGGMGNGTDNGGASNGNGGTNGGNSGANGTNGTAGGDTSTSGNGNGTVSSGINPGLSVTSSLNNFFRSIARIPLK